MKKRDIKTESIKEGVKNLKQLRETCIKNREKRRPTNIQEKGPICDSLDQGHDAMLDSWKYFILLIDKTIEFLGASVEAYEFPDKHSAARISVAGGGNGSFGFGHDVERNTSISQSDESFLQSQRGDTNVFNPNKVQSRNIDSSSNGGFR